MEEDAKNKQGGGQKNPLLQILEDIYSGNKEIQEQLGKFTEVHKLLLSRISEKEVQLNQWSKDIENMGSSIATEIDQNNRENTTRLQEILDAGLENFRNVELGITEKDRNSLGKIEDIFKKYWMLPVIICICSLLMAVLTSFMVIKFYRESVKSKGEIRSEILSSWHNQGKILVDGNEWNALKNERVIVRSFVRDNKAGGKALVNYRKGMVSANSGKPIYKDIDSDEVVKE